MGEILNIGRHMPQARAAGSLDDSRTLAVTPGFDPLALLLAETAAGREASFARLYELTAGRLLSVARGIVAGRSDVAQDVLQESFIRVWRWAHHYDATKGSAWPWLVRIVRNRALTAREQLHRREDGHAEVEEDTAASEDIDPADQAMRSDDARRVAACLANLPANHCRSLTLVYFEGLTHQELATRLEVQLGTAKSWVRRGLAQMNRCLTGGAELDWRAMVAAEYAVGGLRGAVRRGFEKRRERDARYCRAVDLWEDRFASLTESLPIAPVPSQVWKAIDRQIGRERVGFRRPLLWQVATAVLAVVVLALAFRQL